MTEQEAAQAVHEELTSYLDGELDAESVRRVEDGSARRRSTAASYSACSVPGICSTACPGPACPSRSPRPRWRWWRLPPATKARSGTALARATA